MSCICILTIEDVHVEKDGGGLRRAAGGLCCFEVDIVS